MLVSQFGVRPINNVQCYMHARDRRGAWDQDSIRSGHWIDPAVDILRICASSNRISGGITLLKPSYYCPERMNDASIHIVKHRMAGWKERMIQQ